MSDPNLRKAGKIVLTVGIVVVVAGELGYNLTAPSTGARSGFQVVIAGGILLVILGAIAWALGRIQSTIAEDQVNPSLRRTGFLLFVIGVVGLIAGVIGWALTQLVGPPQNGIRALAGVGFLLAMVGAIIVALCHRRLASRLQPTLAGR